MTKKPEWIIVNMGDDQVEKKLPVTNYEIPTDIKTANITFILHEIPESFFYLEESDEHAVTGIFTDEESGLKDYSRFLWGKGLEYPYPVIHFCRAFKNLKTLQKETPAPRHIKYIDSSIWNFYAYDKNELNRCLSCIKENFEKGLYNLLITQEYAELNARLVRNAYLPIYSEDEGHGPSLSPFLFHSEKERKLDKKIEWNKLKKWSEAKTVNWRFLLLDDYADKELVSVKKDSPSNLKKKSIIANLLTNEGFHVTLLSMENGVIRFDHETKLLKKVEKEPIGHISIVWVEDVKAAEKAIRNYRFDVILLDYLLKKTSETEREYSYQLLEHLKNEYEENRRSAVFAPLGKLAIMYISAFTTALSERLQERGLLRNEDYWDIVKGACPTNTPQLFMYYLLHLMNMLYKRIVHLSEGFDGQAITLCDLLTLIYEENPREQANKQFNDLLKMRGKYDLLKRNIEQEDKDILKKKSLFFVKGSVLIHSLFDDIENYSNSFWEHLIHLVYLTAFGTVRQWTEMWEEYVFVKPKLMANASDKNPKPARLCESIEKYIISLKSNA